MPHLKLTLHSSMSSIFKNNKEKCIQCKNASAGLKTNFLFTPLPLPVREPKINLGRKYHSSLDLSTFLYELLLEGQRVRSTATFIFNVNAIMAREYKRVKERENYFIFFFSFAKPASTSCRKQASISFEHTLFLNCTTGLLQQIGQCGGVRVERVPLE